MPKVIENSNGRRMIKFSPDDVLELVSLYTQQCGSKILTHAEARVILAQSQYFLPEDI